MNLPPGARDHGGGRITFPHRGPPPSEPIVGWHVDPEDDYTWLMDYKPCKHMVPLKMVKCDFSGKTRPHDFCELYQMKINPAVCSTCIKREEPA
jgi:hypothetical protein